MIQKVGVLAKEALKEIKRIQKGERELLKTGFEAFDTHIGALLPGDVCVIAGLPGTAKSHTLYNLIDTMLNKEVNKNADNFVSLEFSFEMKMLNKMLRATSSELGKLKKDILFQEFNEEEVRKVNEYYMSLNDDRRSVCQTPVTPEKFYEMTRKYCQENKDKEAILISIDHMLLFTGTDKQAILDKVSEYINLLKLEFDNLYFFLLSQLNRTANSVINEKDNGMIPNNSMLFGSSFMEQLASYIIILTNPFKMGINEYLKVKADRYEYLEEFFTGVDAKSKTSFKTLGNIFCFVTKTRESDTPWKDLFIIEMNLTEKQKEELRVSQEEIAPVRPILPSEMPTFEERDKAFDF